MAEATVRKINEAQGTLYREAPNNIEAEQALLGAILVNNDAFYRVSDFLKPTHFNEPLHRKIFESRIRHDSDGQDGQSRNA